MLGDSVAVYLDAGPSATGIASTIIDATSLVGGDEPLVRVLREGSGRPRSALARGARAICWSPTPHGRRSAP